MTMHQIADDFCFHLIVRSGDQRWTSTRERNLSAKTLEMFVRAPAGPYLLDAFHLHRGRRVVVPNPHRSRLRVDVCALTRSVRLGILPTAFFIWKRIRFTLAQNIEQAWAK